MFLFSGTMTSRVIVRPPEEEEEDDPGEEGVAVSCFISAAIGERRERRRG